MVTNRSIWVRIRNWLKAYPLLEYEVEDLGDFTRVFLRQNAIKEDKLGDNQRLILEAINNNPNISLSMLSANIGISQTAIENNISKLKSLGFIKRIGSTKTGYWEVLK